jgi:type IV pilus assembly protein PilB
MPINDKNLLKVLKETKLVSVADLKTLSKKAEDENITLYNYLITNEIVDQEKLGKAIAKNLNINYINLDNEKVDPKALDVLSSIVEKKENLVVFKTDKNGVHLAVSDPFDTKVIKNIDKRLDQNVIVYFSDDESIKNFLSKLPMQSGDEDLNKLIKEATETDEEIVKAEDLPIIKIVEKILVLGYTSKSSDIHIEPFETRTLVRFRIDGILHDIIEVPKPLHDLITTRIKILSRLRTDEHRAAQDGRLRFKSNGSRIDVRVSIVPVIYGEKVVMRLLAEKARQYDLINLGFDKPTLKRIKGNIKKPWGMILVTGPTGSGKTTTLYSVLKVLNRREVNISTIEDPVEYDVEGINQIQVNKKTNLTFSDGLRAIVRQDPDIIMVGEIRDEETAKIAVNSAMTGHLVLSTLHTNDAPTALPRLMDMGIKAFLVASTINTVIAQRLVRKICPKCQYKTVVTPETLKLIKQHISEELVKKFKLDNPKLQLYYGRGCPQCQSTGYTGRLGIFEVLAITEPIKQLIMSKANSEQIKAKAVELGMTPMIEDGIQKVLEGITTIDEVLRVTRE